MFCSDQKDAEKDQSHMCEAMELEVFLQYRFLILLVIKIMRIFLVCGNRQENCFFSAFGETAFIIK